VQNLFFGGNFEDKKETNKISADNRDAIEASPFLFRSHPDIYTKEIEISENGGRQKKKKKKRVP
jgi:hypothetical protein